MPVVTLSRAVKGGIGGVAFVVCLSDLMGTVFGREVEPCTWGGAWAAATLLAAAPVTWAAGFGPITAGAGKAGLVAAALSAAGGAALAAVAPGGVGGVSFTGAWAAAPVTPAASIETFTAGAGKAGLVAAALSAAGGAAGDCGGGPGSLA